MDRRDALHAILGALVLAPPFLGRTAEALAAEAEAVRASSVTFLGSGQLAAVGALVETIIPATDTPGALVAGVHHFVDFWLAQAEPESQALFVEGLRRLDRAALKRCNGYFRACAKADRIALLEATATSPLHASDREFFALAKSLTVFGFYTSFDGMNEIGWTNHPAPYAGCSHPEHGATAAKGRP